MLEIFQLFFYLYFSAPVFLYCPNCCRAWHYLYGPFCKQSSMQNLPRKSGQQSAICSNSSRLFRDYSLFFFRNKTFLIFKIESWNFQHLFENEFLEISQNFNYFSSSRQFLFLFFLSVVWLSRNFVRFHEILFQTDAESFSFLSWKKIFLKDI